MYISDESVTISVWRMPVKLAFFGNLHVESYDCTGIFINGISGIIELTRRC